MEVSAENIKQFNARLNEHRNKVSRLQMQVEMQEKEVAEQLKKLSEALGKPVTEENLASLYEAYKAELENQLNNGLAILDRVEGVSTPNNGMTTPVGMGAGTPSNPLGQMGAPQQSGQAVGQQVVGSNPQGWSNGFTGYPNAGQAPVQQNPQGMGVAAAPAQNMGVVHNAGLNPGMAVGQAPAGLNPGTPANSQFAGFAQNLGNFDTQQGVDMSTFGVPNGQTTPVNNGVFGV